MAPDDDTTDPDVTELARQVINELDPGTVIDSKVILSRRQVIGLSTGALSLGALSGVGAGDAEAQSAGAIGTDAERVDVFAQDLDVAGSFTPASISVSGSVSADTVDAATGVTGSDVTGTTLTANSTLVDPSGTSHTAELADASDTTSTSVSGGYELTVDGDTYQFNQ